MLCRTQAYWFPPNQTDSTTHSSSLATQVRMLPQIPPNRPSPGKADGNQDFHTETGLPWLSWLESESHLRLPKTRTLGPNSVQAVVAWWVLLVLCFVSACQQCRR